METVVFLGPSLPLEDANTILQADYRPPIRRGDLEDLPAGTIVGIIDGVFEQDLAVSPDEVHRAVDRGVVVYGGSSMGALRAAEVRGVIGIGQVFAWYRDKVVERDDAVALIFDPIKQRALTVPTVCVKYAVERLLRSGTVNAATAHALMCATERLGFKDRSYPRILQEAGLGDRADAEDLIAMLSSLDIKAHDAQAVLEAIDIKRRASQSENAKRPAAPETDRAPSISSPAAQDGKLLIWESGDRVSPEDLLRFVVFTGKTYAPPHIAASLEPEIEEAALERAAQARFAKAAKRWGWMSSEEAEVTFADLGLTTSIVGDACMAEAVISQNTASLIAKTKGHAAVRASILAHMFLDDMALKREILRSGALSWFAELGPHEPGKSDLNEARQVLAMVHRQPRNEACIRHLSGFGFDREAVETWVFQLARARVAARGLCDQITGKRTAAHDAPARNGFGLNLQARPKCKGDLRFCWSLTDAEAEAKRVAERIGITRIGMIGELGDLGTVQIAQASRPGNAWSSSYGSGKSRSSAGAVVGAVLEECEKWAQEVFDPPAAHVDSFAALSQNVDVVDPVSLDLPYDSGYHPDLKLGWVPVVDLLCGADAFMPRDPLTLKRGRHDICYSHRGARKHLATNGLGAGFSLEEAILHGLCEYVERHAQRISELYCTNPGGLGVQPYSFIDPNGVSPQVDDILASLRSRSDAIRVLDITGEIAIPTYSAVLVRKGQVAQGFATHPDPRVAIESALLEAAQTIASATAGGREDLSIQARSLGRHERPRPSDADNVWFWLDPDIVQKPLAADLGYQADDVHQELTWAIQKVEDAGVQRIVVCDMSHPTIAPIHVVRVIVPGLETNNPFYFGPRARLTVLRDLLPRLI
ncbi:ribosomal protein S12 methylthiotransferase accessory factor [Labrenzia sp. EL_142]|nr:ribosomal protein S12 methylthiotransferase accessory factor [Labrenzia sp. EL_142]